MSRVELDRICIGTGTKSFSINFFEECINNNFTTFDLSSIYNETKTISRYINNHKSKNNIKIIYKIWINELGNFRYNGYVNFGEQIRNKCLIILKELGLQKIDILMIHWPLKVNSTTNLSEEFIPEEIYCQLEALVNENIIKEIGLSNFGIIELHRILNNCKIKPFVNQIEINPFNTNVNVVTFCKNNNIQVMAHSPFCFGWKTNHNGLFENCVLNYYSRKYNVSVPVVILNWLINQNIIPVVGTTSIKHLQEFNKAYSFNLTCDEITDISIKCNKNLSLYNSNYDIHNISYYPNYSSSKIKVLVGNESDMSIIDTCDNDFVEKCKKSLTTGPGFLILKNLFADKIELLNNLIPPQPESNLQWNRWNGIGAVKHNIVNVHPLYSEIINNNLIGLIVESLLGWDCKIDNVSYTVSRCGVNKNFFGPHQDSPFEQNIGSKFPPCEYPLVLQVICLVDDFTENNGPFFLVPHSHKLQKRIDLPKGEFPSNACKILGNSGDVVICVGNIYHGACINETNKDRNAFLFEFVSSIIEPRDRFTAEIIDDEILKTFSARLIRLFYGGRERYHLPQTLKIKWEKIMSENNKKNLLNL